ncbi:MAG: hypothetical protein NVSMB65_06630 [Chloroflexota bacterium]
MNGKGEAADDKEHPLPPRGRGPAAAPHPPWRRPREEVSRTARAALWRVPI